MPKYKIFSDSACDLTEDLLKEYDIDAVPFSITFDGVSYYKEAIDIDNKEIYRRMRHEGAYPKTSLPSTQDYMDKFRVYAAQGTDIICVCLSSKLSGSYQSAVTAAEILKEEFPEREFHIIDSKSVAIFQGNLVLEISRMNKKGYDAEKIVRIANIIKEDALTFITVETLEYLQKGGRIGKVSALAGSLFNVKPVILLENGELIPKAKVMGRKKALKELVNCLETAIGHKREEYNIVLGNSDCIEDSDEIKRIAEEKGFTFILPTKDVGTTITAHGGPGIIGLGYVRKHETVE